jgi:hypothetical protein
MVSAAASRSMFFDFSTDGTPLALMFITEPTMGFTAMPPVPVCSQPLLKQQTGNRWLFF